MSQLSRQRVSGRNWARPIIPTADAASATDMAGRGDLVTSHAMTTACEPVARLPKKRPVRKIRTVGRASQRRRIVGRIRRVRGGSHSVFPRSGNGVRQGSRPRFVLSARLHDDLAQVEECLADRAFGTDHELVDARRQFHFADKK